MTQKLSELTTNPNLSTDDLLYVVDDALGTPHSYKATIAAVLGLYNASGLVPYSGATGAVNLGTNGLTVGAITTSGGILPSSSGTQDIGSTSAKWRRNHFTEWHLGSSINEASISVHSQGILVYADTVIGPKFINTGVRMPSTHAYQWSNGTSFTGTSDVFLYRGGPGILQQRNGANAQQFELFGQYTSATSFENLILKTTAAAHQIGSGKGSGGGNNWPVQIGHFNSAGTFTSGLSIATNGETTASNFIYGTSAQFSALGAFGGYGVGTATLAVQALNSSTIAVNIRGQSGQTADLLKCKTSSNTDVFTVGSSGDVTIGTSTTYTRISSSANLVTEAVSNSLGRHYQLIGDSTGSGGPTIFRYGSGGTVEWRSTTGAHLGSTDLVAGRDSAGVFGLYTSATRATKAALTCGAITASGLITGSNFGVVSGALETYSGSTRLQYQSSVFTFIDSGRLDIASGGIGQIRLGGTGSSHAGIYNSGTTTRFRTANDSADAPISCGAITASGAITPATLTDAAAPNGSVYYSSTQSKLVYKDAGGVINNLY